MVIYLNKLKGYNPANPDKISKIKETTNASTNLYNNRQKVIGAFKEGIFPHIDGYLSKKESEEESEEKKIRNRFKEFIEYIEKESKGINCDLFKEYFDFSVLSDLAKRMYEIKNSMKKKKINELVKVIRNKWSNLKDLTTR